MTASTNTQVWSHIHSAIVELLADRGEEPGPMTDATQLNADLGISSVETIHLMIMLEDRLDTPLSFQDLAVRDGEYVEDLELGEIRSFICRTLGIQDSGPGSPGTHANG